MSTHQQRILLVQFADIGDLILTTPAIAALRAAQPNAHLTLLTSAHSAPILPDDLVDEVILFDKSAFNGSKALFKPRNLRRILSIGRYDTIVFFHHFTLKLGTLKFWLMAKAARAKRRIGLQNGNGWFLTNSIPDDGYGAIHQAQYWLNLVGLLGAETAPHPAKIKITPFAERPQRPFAVIHAGSGGYSLARRWDAVQFAAVADQLHDAHGLDIVLVGGKADNADQVKAAMHTASVDLTQRTTLPELAHIIQGATIYIGADSGVMHLAAAVGTPVVALFGPSNHQAWSPWQPDGKTAILRSDVACSPCSYVGHSIGLRDGCPARTCMRLIKAAHVVTTAQQLIEGHMMTATTDEITFPRTWERIRVLGLPVDGITYAQWLDLIAQWVTQGERAYHVCTTNPEFIMIAQDDSNFHNILQRADLCVPDGVGLLWAARRLGQPLPERVTGSDGVPAIAERAAQIGWRLYFLGAAPGIADQAADVLRERYPGVQIVGIYSGSPAPEEEDAIVERINASQADILFVAYGAPKQDKWIARNLPRLQVKMAMGVGGSFDFIAGTVPRAPEWMRQLGLEWLYRLYLQPWRIKRMLRLPRFVFAVLRRGAT